MNYPIQIYENMILHVQCGTTDVHYVFFNLSNVICVL